jgi:hypothetical protein
MQRWRDWEAEKEEDWLAALVQKSVMNPWRPDRGPARNLLKRPRENSASEGALSMS